MTKQETLVAQVTKCNSKIRVFQFFNWFVGFQVGDTHWAFNTPKVYSKQLFSFSKDTTNNDECYTLVIGKLKINLAHTNMIESP